MTPFITRTQMLHLLDKLARDDLFRARFERSPRNALIEAGFAVADVDCFPAEQLAPGTLAPKPAFAAEHERVQTEVFDTHACMVVPGPMLTSRMPVTKAGRLARAS